MVWRVGEQKGYLKSWGHVSPHICVTQSFISLSFLFIYFFPVWFSSFILSPSSKVKVLDFQTHQRSFSITQRKALFLPVRGEVS